MLRPLPHRNRLARIFRRDGLPRQNGNQRRLHSRLSADDELRRHAGFRSACKRTAQNVVAGSQRLGRVIRRVKVQNRSRKRGKVMPAAAASGADGEVFAEARCRARSVRRNSCGGICFSAIRRG